MRRAPPPAVAALAVVAAGLSLPACGREPPIGTAEWPAAGLAELRAQIAYTEREIAREEAEIARLRGELAGLGSAPEPRIVTRFEAGVVGDDPTSRRDLHERPEVRAHGQRSGKASLGREGGSEATEKAVRGALSWLARHQEADGRWRAADPAFDVAVSSLALLAFLGNGHTHRAGDSKEPAFRAALEAGGSYLERRQGDDGSIGFDPAKPETIVNHALAAQALAELFACSRDLAFEQRARRAVDFCIAAQNPSGGFGRGVGTGADDPALTGLFVLALGAAADGGIEVPRSSFDRALASLDRAPEDPDLTGLIVLARIVAGQKPADEAVRQGLRALLAAPPARDAARPDLAAWCAGAHAVFQATAPGSPDWKAWNAALQAALLGRQREGGDEDGSFDATGARGEAGGRAYATAVAALTLEVYYRLERMSR